MLFIWGTQVQISVVVRMVETKYNPTNNVDLVDQLLRNQNGNSPKGLGSDSADASTNSKSRVGGCIHQL